MSDVQFLTAIKKVADKYGMEVKVNLKHHAIGFVGDYDIPTRNACEKELDEIFRYTGTIQTSKAVHIKRSGNC
jgi:hypothetical protein